MYLKEPFKKSDIQSIYKLFSIKNNALLFCKDYMQFSCCFWLDFIPDIESFDCHPEKFYYPHMGKNYLYSPDFLVTNKDGFQYYIGLMSFEEWQKPNNQLEFANKRIAATERNIPLFLVTDKQIKDGVLFENLKLLHQATLGTDFNRLQNIFNKMAIPRLNQLQKIIFEFVSNKRTCRIGEIDLLVDIDKSVIMSNSRLLISTNNINADIYSSLIDGSTVVCVSHKDNFAALTLYDEYNVATSNVSSKIDGNTDFESKNSSEIKLKNNIKNELNLPIKLLLENKPVNHLCNELQNDHDANNDNTSAFTSISADNQYKKSTISFDDLPDNVKYEARQRHKLYCLVENDLRKGWTKRNLDPLIERHINAVVLPKPSWRTLARWHKLFVDQNGDISVFVKHHYLKGNNTPKVIGDSDIFEKVLSIYLNTKRQTVAEAYRHYRNYIVSQNQLSSEYNIPMISYTAFNNRIKKRYVSACQ